MRMTRKILKKCSIALVMILIINMVFPFAMNSVHAARANAGARGVVAIAGGYAHLLGLKSDGTVEAWGNTANGRTNVPTALSSPVKGEAIAGGSSHSLALKSDGTVEAWGNNNNGQSTVPDGLSGVSAIASGYSHSLALKSDGTVVAWGWNLNGQRTVPVGLSGVVAIAAGTSH